MKERNAYFFSYILQKSLNLRLLKLFLVIFTFLSLQLGCGRQTNDSKNVWVWEEHPELGVGSVIFTHVPMSYDYFKEIWPLGHINLPEHPIPTSAGGFQFNEYLFTSEAQDVVAPASGYITWIRKLVVNNFGVIYEDYAIRIYHTNTFVSMFDHLSSIDPSILSKIGSLQNGENKVYVKVNAGDVIGKTGKNIAGLGWYLYNREVSLDLINKEKYGPYNQYAVYPLDYFNEPLKSQLYAYVKRVKPPKSGKWDFDINGTLQGNWIVEGSDPISKPEPWSVWLSFCYDMFDPDCKRISIGQDLGKTVGETIGILTSPKTGPEFTAVTPSSGKVVYRLFTVTEGEEFNFGHPYDETIKYTLLVQMISDSKIKVELFSGDVANPEFTSKAMYYTR